MKMLYHYCSVEKCYSILDSKTLRLSDIKKSNDYKELSLFFPEIFWEIEKQYKENPFFFIYKGLTNEKAILALTEESYIFWKKQFDDGTFSNYVVCFSEEPDSLGQWRGYANNASGCCLGFSKEVLEQYCAATGDVLQLRQVKYKTKVEIQKLVSIIARSLLDQLTNMRENIGWEFFHDEEHPGIDPILEARVNIILRSVFVDSLRFKAIGFKDEKEWRLFFSEAPSRNATWLLGENKEGSNDIYKKTRGFLEKRIGFMPISDDLISYCGISFDEFSQNPIKEIWTGPKNKIVKEDFDLFLKIHDYDDVEIKHSGITYC